MFYEKRDGVWVAAAFLWESLPERKCKISPTVYHLELTGKQLIVTSFQLVDELILFGTENNMLGVSTYNHVHDQLIMFYDFKEKTYIYLVTCKKFIILNHPSDAIAYDSIMNRILLNDGSLVQLYE